MGFFFWLLCSILVVALVLLLFPFSFRMEFEVGERGARAFFFFFKKKIYEAKKNWGKENLSEAKDPVKFGLESNAEKADAKSEESSSPDVDAKSEKQESPSVIQSPGTESGVNSAKDPVKSGLESNAESAKQEAESETQDAPAVTPEAEEKGEEQEAPPTVEAVAKKPAETPKTEKMDSSPVAEVSESATSDDEKATEDQKPRKEKRKLTDREFWTIALTPDLDARAFGFAKKIMASALNLFRIRFIDCFVEGIRMDYLDMGYAAALNAFLKTYPYVGAWDFRMDWCRDKELRAQGTITASINLLRLFCFTLKTAVYAGFLFLSFWRRRARVLKTNELPEIGFIRRKIIDFIVEE